MMSKLPTDSSYLTTQVVNQIDEIAALKAENARLRAANAALAGACEAIVRGYEHSPSTNAFFDSFVLRLFPGTKSALALNARAGT